VPDRAAAERLTEALAAFGFAQVAARPLPPQAFRPDPGVSWEVQAVDEGRYPRSLAGYRQQGAVERQACAIVRAHGGFPTLIVRFCRDVPALQRARPPILRLNPGSRPPVLLVRTLPAPPPGQLSLTPDSPVRVLIRPDSLGLDAIPWQELTAAYGSAAEIPAFITGLAQGRRGWKSGFGDLVFGRLVHQGTCYSATAPALVVLARLAASGALPAAKRRDIYLALQWAAWQSYADIIDDRYAAAACGREPQPSRWAAQVRDAVSSVTPGLLARWASEPSACRLALAVLAATFPDHGQAVARQMAVMADEYAGTQAGAFARLAHQLVSRDMGGVMSTVAEIACWNDRINGTAVDESIEPELRALDLLSHVAASAAAPFR
jgi:hypothetical protein